MNVVLIGYRGTGKTTVARLLAERLGCQCIDCDQEIERVARKTIREIFAEQGEEGFRDLESLLIERLARSEDTVLSLGGGAVLREQNRQILRHSGTVIWLKADSQTIYDRLAADPNSQQNRPALTEAGGLEEIQQLLECRSPLYRQIAHFEVDTQDKTPEQVASEIVSLLEQPS